MSFLAAYMIKKKCMTTTTILGAETIILTYCMHMSSRFHKTAAECQVYLVIMCLSCISAPLFFSTISSKGKTFKSCLLPWRRNHSRTGSTPIGKISLLYEETPFWKG